MQTDRFGFVTRKECAPTPRELAREKRRCEKWRKMLFSSPNIYQVMRSPKFSTRLAKGVPEPFRGLVWANLELLMVNSSEGVNQGRSSVVLLDASALLSQLPQQEGGGAGAQIHDAILKDLGRTLPSHEFFKHDGGRGQLALERVLCSYAIFDPELGFTQGMSFIAALLLLYMGEERALSLFTSIMNKKPCVLRTLFRPPRMDGVHLRLFQYGKLLERRLPKTARHFELLGFEPSMYAVNWFTTVFTASPFPFTAIVRIWDLFLMQGWPIVFAFTIAFWKQLERRVLALERFEQVFELYRAECVNLDVDRTIALALGLRISEDEVEELKC